MRAGGEIDLPHVRSRALVAPLIDDETVIHPDPDTVIRP
jgi:hypothetical protein